MNHFAVFSGFLGSGKTTTMMALTDYCTAHYGKAAMISNDLGSQGLADHRYALRRGCNASELTGGCICYQTENLVARLETLFGQDNCLLAVSDIPGFGVGALEHVYHTLNREYPGKFTLAPFAVLAEPRTVACLRTCDDHDLHYILHTQLAEADVIVLNKCDLLTPEEQKNTVAFLTEQYPHARVIPISARTGYGLDLLARALLEGSASLRAPDIGYGGSAFRSAMKKFSEYYTQFYAQVCCSCFDASAYLSSLASAVQKGIADISAEIPHMKFLAWEPEGDWGKADLLGIHRPIEISRRFSEPAQALAVVINGTALCSESQLEAVMAGAIRDTAEQFRLTVTIFQKDCFDVMKE